jgi:hypothetical protein
LSKRRAPAWATIFAGSPRHDLHVQADEPAAEASFLREQTAFLYTEDFREELNLGIRDNRALSFDVGEDVAGRRRDCSSGQALQR